MTSPNNHAIKPKSLWSRATWHCPVCQQFGSWLVRSDSPSEGAAKKLHQIESPGCDGTVSFGVAHSEEGL